MPDGDNYMESEWHIIVDFPRYQISKDGSVMRISTGRILKTTSNGKYGYQHVGLWQCNGDGYRKYVHVLVAEAFIGPRPVGLQIDHIDGNPKNNHLSNLRYLSPHENNQASLERGNWIGERNGMARLTERDIYNIRDLVKNGNTLSYVARLFMISFQHVSDIFHRKRWAHL